MSFSISGISAAPISTPVAPKQAVAPVTSSGALEKAKPSTRSGHEMAPAPTRSTKPQQLDSYFAMIKAKARQGPASAEQKIVEATGGTTLPPRRPPDTPAMAAFRAKQENVWASVGPVGPPPPTYGPKAKMGPAAMPAAPKALGVNLPKYG